MLSTHLGLMGQLRGLVQDWLAVTAVRWMFGLPSPPPTAPAFTTAEEIQGSGAREAVAFLLSPAEVLEHD